MKIQPENRFWIWIYSFTGFIMLTAMSVFGWLAWTSRQEPGTRRVASARAVPASTTIPDERLELLASFRPPDYVPENSAPREFQDAMRSYTNQDFKSALPKLRVAAKLAPTLVAAQFYLGICLLLTGDRIPGIQELRGVTEAGETPYLERARFYLAKGLISEHDVSRAKIELQKLIEQHGDLEKQATVLLAQIS